MSTKEFGVEFARRVKDAGYADEEAKVLLVSSLNDATLAKLDTFIATRDPSAAATQETTMERLARISYSDMIGFLKQSNLQDIATRGAGGTGLVRKDPKQAVANVVEEETIAEWVSDAYPVSSGFLEAGVMAVSSDKSKGGTRSPGKSKKKVSASDAATDGSYTPVPVPPIEDQSKVFQACLAMADQEMDPALC